MFSPQLEGDYRWALVQRIASSRHFAKAPQLHDFLLFIAVRTLEGREAELNEYSIGCSVLGRSKTFNPAEDNIVRVQARHLRKKIEEYFSAEGLDESLVLTIPKGGYIPHFEPRPLPPGPLQTTAAGNSRIARALWALSGALAAAAILIAVWWFSHEMPPDHPLLTRVFRPGQESRIVVSDSSLVAAQDILRTDLTVQEYTAPHFLENILAKASSPGERAVVDKLFSRQYTSLGDLNVSSRLLDSARLYGGSTRLRFSRHLNLREFKTGNFIIVGSRRGIPWVGLFENHLNFAARWNAETGSFYFGNAAPRPGEQAEYGNSGQDTYAMIALVPNLDRTGDVLLLSGLTMEGTEAAGEFVTEPERAAEFRNLLGERAQGYFEILLRLSVVGGTARNPTIVASRSVASREKFR